MPFHFLLRMGLGTTLFPIVRTKLRLKLQQSKRFTMSPPFSAHVPSIQILFLRKSHLLTSKPRSVYLNTPCSPLSQFIEALNFRNRNLSGPWNPHPLFLHDGGRMIFASKLSHSLTLPNSRRRG